MSASENPHAGQGRAIPLDIGGDVGALVVDMPPKLDGAEIEIRPMGGSRTAHVGVVARLAANGRAMYSAVFFEVPADTYELYQRPDGPVRLRVDVVGGQVVYAEWPHR
jgi:hypothetical protein